MPYQVLARKWRPKKFEDVVGQFHITRSLKNAIIRHQIGHAYLFAGTRGIGKTSVARIFAKAIQCQHKQQTQGNPCLQCQSCQEIDKDQSLDVLEIDGASHNGVDHIRQLVENIQFLPTSGEKRIYIIDEVHMLTKEAFNALLKTLEEPPAHVIFMLATTLPDKLLGTVLSRCQRFDFRNISTEETINHLSYIVEKENIKVDSIELLKHIANQAKGSIRDALSLLDQVLSFTIEAHITDEVVTLALGIARTKAITEIVSAILMGDSLRCGQVFQQVLKENVDLEKLVLAILERFYQIIQLIVQQKDSLQTLYKEGLVLERGLDRLTRAELFWIYECLARDCQWVLKSLLPEKTAEIVLQKVCCRRDFFSGSSLLDEGPSPKEMPASSMPERPEKKVFESAPTLPTFSMDQARKAEMSEMPAMSESAEVAEVLIEKVGTQEVKIPEKKNWEEFLKYIYAMSPALSANLEQGNILNPIQFQGENIKIELRFKESGRIFLEYLKDKDVWGRLLKALSDFYSVPLSGIQFDLDIISSNMEEKLQFQTLAEKEKKKNDYLLGQHKERLLGNPYIKMAEELFNAKIDKVIINNS